MRGRQKRGEPRRIAYGCLTLTTILVVAVGALVVVFLWDVNLPA